MGSQNLDGGGAAEISTAGPAAASSALSDVRTQAHAGQMVENISDKNCKQLGIVWKKIGNNFVHLNASKQNVLKNISAKKSSNCVNVLKYPFSYSLLCNFIHAF